MPAGRSSPLRSRGAGAARYVRRLVILFLFGLAHMLLLWMGDILTLYAVMGAFLLLFRRASDRTILVWAVALWLVPILWSLGYTVYEGSPIAGFKFVGFDNYVRLVQDPTFWRALWFGERIEPPSWVLAD